MDAKPLRSRFNKVDEIIKIYNGIRYLELPHSYNEIYYRIYKAIFDRINYVIIEKSGIIDSINHNFARIRIDSYNSLPIEKKLTFHVIILIKSVVNEDKNNYYYYIFLEKGSYNESKTQYFCIIFVYYKCYISTELTFLKELMLIKQVYEKSEIFVTIGIS